MITELLTLKAETRFKQELSSPPPPLADLLATAILLVVEMLPLGMQCDSRFSDARMLSFTVTHINCGYTGLKAVCLIESFERINKAADLHSHFRKSNGHCHAAAPKRLDLQRGLIQIRFALLLGGSLELELTNDQFVSRKAAPETVRFIGPHEAIDKIMNLDFRLTDADGCHCKPPKDRKGTGILA